LVDVTVFFVMRVTLLRLFVNRFAYAAGESDGIWSLRWRSSVMAMLIS
jgi:hypothetical protein